MRKGNSRKSAKTRSAPSGRDSAPSGADALAIDAVAAANVDGALAAAAASLDGLVQDVFDTLGIGVVEFDRAHRVQRCNARATGLLPKADDVSEMLELARFDQGTTDWRSVVREVLESGSPRQFETLCRASPGSATRYFRLTIASRRGDAVSAIEGGLLVIEEITHRITMERQLAVSERLASLGQLAAKVAHELNNPLDGILRYVNLSRRVSANVEDARLRDYLDYARTGLMRMAGIVRSLLEFSRGGGYDGPRDTRLTALIDDAVRSFESPASEAGISIICDYDAGDAPIHRPDNLFQVFCNLIKNAIDAMPDGGRLMIRTRTGDSAGEIRFEDTGVGLPEDTSKLFEPFFTTKSNGNGTGLGLAVCREIVEKYGGRIEAESRSGGGAAFVIHLPLATAAAGVGRTTDARIVVGDELTETSRDD